MKAVELPVAHSTPLDRTRDRGGAVTVTVNLVVRAPAPTSSLLCCATGAHQPCHWTGRPRSERGQGVRLDHWVKTDEIHCDRYRLPTLSSICTQRTKLITKPTVSSPSGRNRPSPAKDNPFPHTGTNAEPALRSLVSPLVDPSCKKTRELLCC
jgi:hypothetical protein